MAKKGSFSKVYDKNGDYVDVEAARFDGTRSFQIHGDVTASQTWNGDPSSPLTLNASIGAKKVTTDKINDKAVQAQQIDDGAVGLVQIATTAMNGTVQDNDSKLATHAAVKTYVDAQISGQGTYLGKHTVAEINAMVTDNLHNGDRVMTSDSGTINLGPGGLGFDVEAGEDLILYKSGSTVQWDSMDGNFKTKQTAVSDPTASGSTLEFIDSITQDENGEITASKKAVQDGTTSQKGVVQLAGSIGATVASENNKAASEKAVRDAINALDSNATSTDGTNVQVKVTETDGKISAVNITTDNTENKNNKVTSFQSTPDNTHYPSEKLVKDSLDAKVDANKVVSIADVNAYHSSQTGGKWYKVASKRLTTYLYNDNTIWDIFFSNTFNKQKASLNVCIRLEGTGTTPIKRICSIYCDEWNSDNKVKVVTRGIVGSVDIEIWVNVNANYSSVMLVERNSSSYSASSTKGTWTYTNGSGAGDNAPTTDETNNVYVYDAEVIKRQHAIASPTNNNLVAMDASGLVKDSGIGSGTLSTALTKLDGIAAGAEVNVQADWNQTNSSADDFIKNKPYRSLYDTTETLHRVCTGTIEVGGGGLSIMARSSNGVIYGELVWRDNAKLFLKMVNGVYPSSQTIKLYVRFLSSSVYVYVRCGSYTQFKVAPLVNNPKSAVNFDNFGETIDSLPEGATEITPVWVANSASSSGTAPVKVDAYGALTPVPMDSTPTASSTNLMTSGDIKTALDLKVNESDVQDTYSSTSEDPISGKGVAEALVTTGSGYVQVRGPASNTATVFKFSVSSSYTTNGIVEVWCSSGAHYHLQFTVGANAETVSFDGTYAERSSYVSVAYKYDSTAKELTVAVNQLQYYSIISKKVVTLKTNTGTADVAYEYVNGATDNTYTTYYCARRAFIKNNNSAVGSTSVPAYVKATGEIDACTDDFVHDGDVKSTFSATGTDPVNGAAVAAALGTLDVTDTAVSHQFVTAVSETDGKVSITRAQPAIADVDGLQTALDGKEGSITWMTEQEARSIWANAKAAVAAS